jgi:hypothetical protein
MCTVSTFEKADSIISTSVGLKTCAVLHVAIVHLDVGLGEEAEDLRQQVALRCGRGFMPVPHVVGERNFQPVHALLRQPGFIGPGIRDGL